MKRHILLFLILAVTLTMAACVKLGGKPLDKRYFQINPTRSTAQVQTQYDFVLKVRRLSISNLYNTRELVYRGKNGRIESDFYNMFFVPPAAMLTSELRLWLRGSNLFSHIIEPGSMVVPGLTLEGVVNSLYGDYSLDTPAAVVEMQFFVVDESSTNNEIVFSSTYVERIPMPESTATSLVNAMTQGVQTIYTNLETDLAAAGLK
ncbi:ABC-type transport auxiliary lipoprotein family protein [uncultured Pseudodesulfovibrio sp.]|uniref:ABC-type transport auxiliary lipoprotein family protein n=1 Tax=uncultured Pseudodesulfovibrio sp. TaxID=2035858 RepID=UPI0029C94BC5|nr:ABC-type transport auxiliary lipoprotein family protein [uncultured Pseudodesulfovibrio sp.]